MEREIMHILCDAVCDYKGAHVLRVDFHSDSDRACLWVFDSMELVNHIYVSDKFTLQGALAMIDYYKGEPR